MPKSESLQFWQVYIKIEGVIGVKQMLWAVKIRAMMIWKKTSFLVILVFSKCTFKTIHFYICEDMTFESSDVFIFICIY